MNRLSPALEFKRASLDEQGAFSGYASTFDGPPDSFGDIVAPGAFRDSLQQHTERGTWPPMLWAHDDAELVGVWHRIEEDAAGLKVAGKLTLQAARGGQAYALMKDGAALGLSIGYRVPKGGATYDAHTGVRTLNRVDLVEVSLVAVAANPAAKITHLKSAVTSIRDYENLLRDVAGYSKREAKRLASGGWPALSERDVPSEGQLLEVMRDIQRKTTELETLLKR